MKQYLPINLGNKVIDGYLQNNCSCKSINLLTSENHYITTVFLLLNNFTKLNGLTHQVTYITSFWYEIEFKVFQQTINIAINYNTVNNFIIWNLILFWHKLQNID